MKKPLKEVQEMANRGPITHDIPPDDRIPEFFDRANAKKSLRDHCENNFDALLEALEDSVNDGMYENADHSTYDKAVRAIKAASFVEVSS
jgi:hypothetical protein